MTALMLASSIPMTSFAADGVADENTTEVVVEDFGATEEVAEQGNAEDTETLEIEASADNLFEVPYISTYYFNPKPLTTDTIQIPLYLTDYAQSEYLKNDTTKKLDLIYEIDGVKKTISDVPLGDYTLTIGKLSAGMHRLSLQALDKTTGLKSHKLNNELWVVTSYDIPASKVYKMTTADLSAYGINNQDSKNATDLINTRDGLTKLFADKQAAGFEKIVLVKGTYRINGENARETCIKIPSHFTVDMNGSTFKLDTITRESSGCIVLMDDVIDAHLENGILEGDRYERQALNLERDGLGEAINTVLIKGGKYCSLNDLTIKNTTGHTIWSLPVMDLSLQYKLKGFTNTAIIGGKEVASSKYSTSAKVDLTKYISWDANEDYFYIGFPAGYRGIRTKSAIVYVSFYNASEAFMETVEACQFRKVAIPQNAKYARVTVYDTNIVDSDAQEGIYLYPRRLGDYHELKNISFENTRTCAIATTSCSNFLIEDITYTNCGDSITPLPVDFEDGWDECQDVYYRNNEVVSKADHTTTTIVDNAGFNHVYENCINHQITVNGRLTGVVVRNMNDVRNTVEWDIGKKICNSYGRIYNNNCGAITFYKKDKNGVGIADLSTLGEAELAEIINFNVKNCTIQNGSNANSNYCNAYAEKITYEGCTFTNFAGKNAVFRNCTIQPTGYMNDKLYFYDCTFKALDDREKIILNLNAPRDAKRVFDNCKFEGKVTIGTENFHTGTFTNCDFDDVNFEVAVDSKEGKILFDNCTINSSAENIIHTGPFAYSTDYMNIEFKDCDITHTGANIIGFVSLPSKNSQILFDHCTINKTSGALVKWLTNYTRAQNIDKISVDVIFKNSTVNKSLEIDREVPETYARVQFVGDGAGQGEVTKKNGILTENGKIYYYINDVKQTGWQTVSGKKYYFGSDYAAKTGLQTISNKKYYFNTSGVMLTGWQTISSKKYYFGTDGAMLTGWQTISSKKYYFGTDGAMLTGWQTIDSKKYYLGTDGVMVTGTVTIDSKKYEFGTDGVFIKEIVEEDPGKEPEKDPEQSEKKNGFVEEDGKTYYYVDDVKQLGWKQLEDAWYYFGSDGVMATKKWVSYKSDWYYFNADGTMATKKWVAYKGDWYYFGADGIMATDKWVAYGGDWYYFGADGIMVTEKWVAYSGDWYYFGADGIMATNKWVAYGKGWYYFGKDGVMLTSKWLQYKNDWYYFNASGAMVTGKQTINGKIYNFNSSGIWIN